LCCAVCMNVHVNIKMLCIEQSLRQELESQYKRGKLSLKELHPHDAATLLKQFLRELPTPLLTFEYLDAFAQVNSKLHKILSFAVNFFQKQHFLI